MTASLILPSSVHQVLVDLEAPGRVDDHDVPPLRARLLDPHLRGLDRLRPGEDRNLDLPPELLQLVDGRRTLEVGGDERRRAVLLAEQQRQLGGRGRLARPLEAGEQDHGRPLAREDELGVPRAHQRRQLFVDDLHDLLAGSEAAGDVLAEGALLDARDEVLDDAEVDVGLEQRQTDLAHRARDHLFVELSAAPKRAEGGIQLVPEGVEHRRNSLETAGLAP